MTQSPQVPIMPSYEVAAPAAAHTFYRHGLVTLSEAHIPFLVGGAHALTFYTGVFRPTKDFDILLRPRDCERALLALARAGYHTDLTFPHWLGKAFCGEFFIDIIFSSGNGVCRVDDQWFEYAVGQQVLGVPTRLCPPEEMIWSKAFVQERERHDGADIAHILRGCGKSLAWPRLLCRFGSHWRLLLSHLILFGFIYPAERTQIPPWVMQKLLSSLQNEPNDASPHQQLCQGTLLSREQYLIDILRWGYKDARLLPHGRLTQEEIDHWTAAINQET
jgi:hypothetical protein